jgi:quercetin dioxygenase-like cupin family protein
VQRYCEPIEQIYPGGSVWIAPHEKHWHGAAPTTAMTHFTVVEKTVEEYNGWMEHVSDEQYLAG